MARINLRNKRERKRFIFYCSMIALPLAQVIIFYFCVNINSILLAFKNYEPKKIMVVSSIEEAVNVLKHFGSKEVMENVEYKETGEYYYKWTGFEHFIKVFKEMFTNDDAAWKFAFKNSIKLWLISSVTSMVLALFFSYYIYKKGLLKNFFRVTLFLPSIISGIVMVILFQNLIDQFIPELIYRSTKERPLGLLSDHNTTMAVLIFYNILMSFGANVLLLSSAMSSIPSSMTEAAQIDGANKLKEFFYIVFPQIFPTFLTIFVISLAGVFANQMNLFSFYGTHAEPQFATVGYKLYKETYVASIPQYSDLAAIGIILTLIIVPITLGIRKLLEKVGPSNE